MQQPATIAARILVSRATQPAGGRWLEAAAFTRWRRDVNSKILVLIGAALLTGAVACEEKADPAAVGGAKAPAAVTAPAPAPAPAKTATPEEAKAYFTSRCVVCHGELGKGDGPGSAALKPKPRDLSAAEWQDSIDDAYIKKVLLGGGAAVGKSFIMPGNPDLKGNDAMQTELVKFIRALKK